MFMSKSKLPCPPFPAMSFTLHVLRAARFSHGCPGDSAAGVCQFIHKPYEASYSVTRGRPGTVSVIASRPIEVQYRD